MRLSFTVDAKPQPQGSSRAFRHKYSDRIIVTSDNAKLKGFRQHVQSAAKEAVNRFTTAPSSTFPCHAPVALEIYFRFVKPKSAKKRQHHTVKPDIDKLCRAVLDGLTGIVFNDDSQVVRMIAEKQYGERDEVQVIAMWD